jgi:hypothetical protein
MRSFLCLVCVLIVKKFLQIFCTMCLHRFLGRVTGIFQISFFILKLENYDYDINTCIQTANYEHWVNNCWLLIMSL